MADNAGLHVGHFVSLEPILSTGGVIQSSSPAERETMEGEVKFLETGTKLSFRPYIGNDGYIRMDIFPKDSTGSLNEEGVPDETLD
jgi:hypothetical protein